MAESSKMKCSLSPGSVLTYCEAFSTLLNVYVTQVWGRKEEDDDLVSLN